MNLLKPGIYSFRVANAHEHTSKSGNEMIKLTLEVFDDEGKTYTMFDYLLEAMSTKLFSFCYATNLDGQYSNGVMTAQDCIGKCGYVHIRIQKGKESPQGGTYPDKNEVKSYMSTKPDAKRNAAPLISESDANGFDDDLPF